MKDLASARTMHVLHFIGGLQLGGAETLLYRLATSDSSRTLHEVICLGEPGWYSEPLQKAGIKVHHLGIRAGLSALSKLPQLWSLVRDSEADVIQSWMYASNVVASVASRLSGIPLAWGIHASSFRYARPASRVSAYTAGRYSRWLTDYVVNCSSQSAAFHASYGYAQVPNAVIHNGYDPCEFFPHESTRRLTRELLGLSSKTFVIGSIARWHPQKDLPNLLSALQLLRLRGVPVRCLLIGNGLGPHDAPIASATHSLGLQDVVIPLGARADTPQLARSIDLHVLASSGGEAFPNVIAESMLSGTPNVATDVGDTRLMIAKSGWVVPPRNAEALSQAIESAYKEWRDHPSRWKERRYKARQAIEHRFSFETMARAYENVWAEISGQTLSERDDAA